jgi:hypothetical protein
VGSAAETAALAAVLTAADVTPDFGGSGGPPQVASPAHTAATFGAGRAAALCDPTNTLGTLPPAVAGAASARFESTSPLAEAASWSAVYATEPMAASVFDALASDLPCIGEQDARPYNTAGVTASAYPVAAPKVGDDDAAVDEDVTLAAGTVGATVHIVLVRVARTLLLFDFVSTVPENESIMMGSVVQRARTS